MLRRILALALAGAACSAGAQLIPDVNIDWQELEAPPPPAVRTRGLLPVEVKGTTMQFGVDPSSITVGEDRVVRYVVVATSPSGTVNAMYEGIRCDTGQVKVYARHNPDSGWVTSRNSDWQNIFLTANSRHSLAIARSGACMDGAPNGSPKQIEIELRAPVDRRFQRGGVNR